MNIIREVKEFFKLFPAKGSLAYRLAILKFNREQRKENKHDNSRNEIVAISENPLVVYDLNWDPTTFLYDNLKWREASPYGIEYKSTEDNTNGTNGS